MSSGSFLFRYSETYTNPMRDVSCIGCFPLDSLNNFFCFFVIYISHNLVGAWAPGTPNKSATVYYIIPSDYLRRSSDKYNKNGECELIFVNTRVQDSPENVFLYHVRKQ